MMEMDFEIGCIIKDKLIPFSVLWFTGEAAEYEDDDDDMFGDEEGDGMFLCFLELCRDDSPLPQKMMKRKRMKMMRKRRTRLQRKEVDDKQDQGTVSPPHQVLSLVLVPPVNPNNLNASSNKLVLPIFFV
jgi:hypothetical protein